MRGVFSISSLFFVISLPLYSGEWALPKSVELKDPPPSVVWGPFQLPDLRGLQWGLYGLGYNGKLNKLDAVYCWQPYIRRYRSLDSLNPLLPETIRVALISSPVGDSFQDFTYSRYDNSIWIHSSKYKRVYKIKADDGTLLRQFSSPALRYPVGIAFNEREKRLYLIDRMDEGVFPCSLYITDTLGIVIDRWSLAHLGYSYAGARCLDFDYTNSNPNWPTLLLLYSYFSSSGALDSCVLFQLDRLNGSIISRARLPNLAGYINNARGVAWDPRSGDYWISIMQSPDNYLYKLDGWHTPYSTDVGIVSLLAPIGQDSLNRVIVPKVVVRNFGTASATFPIRMRIGTTYDEMRNKTLLPGTEDTVNFPSWTASPPGMVTVKCSTSLSGDLFSRNDLWLDSFRVLAPPMIYDVGVISLTSPPSAIDSGTEVTPACTVYNYGNQTVSYFVRAKIGDFYHETSSVSNHTPQTKLFLTFPSWEAVQRGTWVVSCSTELSGDLNPQNDRRTSEVFVRVRDVGGITICSPPLFVDSGTRVVPSCSVYNYGNTTENYPVRTKIGDFYNETALVTNHQPGTKLYLTFPDWFAVQVGSHSVKCSTELSGDFHPENDDQEGTTTVGVLDCGVREIYEPTGIIDSSTIVIPRVLVKNFGNRAASFPVWMEIGNSYEDSVWTELPPRDSATVQFSPWLASPCDTFLVKSFTALSGDRNPTNDTSFTWVIVQSPTHDVGVVEIISPIGEIDSGEITIPRASVQNFGTVSEYFLVRFTIGDFYTAETIAFLEVGGMDTVSFPEWLAQPTGLHLVKCTTALSGDNDPTNDCLSDSVRVLPPSGKKENKLKSISKSLLSFTPNPFVNKTTLFPNLPSQVTVLIYNSGGNLVRTLSGEGKEIVWDGRDEKEKILPKGVYFYYIHPLAIKPRKVIKM